MSSAIAVRSQPNAVTSPRAPIELLAYANARVVVRYVASPNAALGSPLTPSRGFAWRPPRGARLAILLRCGPVWLPPPSGYRFTSSNVLSADARARTRAGRCGAGRAWGRRARAEARRLVARHGRPRGGGVLHAVRVTAEPSAPCSGAVVPLHSRLAALIVAIAAEVRGRRSPTMNDERTTGPASAILFTLLSSCGPPPPG